MLNPLKNKDFADKRVRQAFLYAIDRKSILQNIYHIPDPTLLNCLYLDPTLNPPDVHTYDFDPAKAKSLLTEAGVDPSKWGELDFDTYYGDQGSLDAMTAIQANLADVGHQGQDHPDGQRGVEQEVLRRRQLHHVDDRWRRRRGRRRLRHRHPAARKNAWPKGGNGWKGYHYENAELDAALDAVGTEFDAAKRTTAIQNVCKIDAEEQPFINLWATTRYWFISDKIHNFVSTPGPGMGNYYKAAETWFVQP